MVLELNASGIILSTMMNWKSQNLEGSGNNKQQAISSLYVSYVFLKYIHAWYSFVELHLTSCSRML